MSHLKVVVVLPLLIFGYHFASSKSTSENVEDQLEGKSGARVLNKFLLLTITRAELLTYKDYEGEGIKEFRLNHARKYDDLVVHHHPDHHNSTLVFRDDEGELVERLALPERTTAADVAEILKARGLFPGVDQAGVEQRAVEL